jgi:hypothetical protein
MYVDTEMDGEYHTAGSNNSARIYKDGEIYTGEVT